MTFLCTFILLDDNASIASNPNLTAIRQYYRNTDYHPSKIVRAYRMTRTWLTDHFVIGERRFENIYSGSFIVVFAIFFIIILYVNIEVGNEGLDVDRTNIKASK